MARWSLDDISIATPLPLNGSTYGHEFSAVFRLRYTVGRSISNVFSRNPVALQKEMPRLEWNETITMKETAANLDTPQFWQFKTDMYRHNPASPSIVAWRKRYVMAYRHVAHQPAPDNVNGSVKIWSSSNRPLDVRDLGGPQHYAAGQALAVRNYIAANGCLMVITLSDTPAINTTSTGMKERLVEFDIGVQGSGKRVRAYQYIKFNQKLSSAAWTRDFGRHASPIHLKPGPREVRVEPPVGVALARVATPFATYGEYD